MNFKDKSCLIIGVGIEIEHAARLAKDFGKVYYWSYTLSDDGFPQFEDSCLGKNFDNIIRIDDYYEVIDKVDLICFFFVGFTSMADYWRGRGKRVFGAGRSEKLELDRMLMRRTQKEIGLPVQKTYFITGVNTLKKFLEENKDNKYFIKINKIRGTQETFSSEYADDVLKSLDYDLGPFADEFKFMVEEELNGDGAVEAGFDGFFTGQKFIEPACFGYEKHSAYIAKFDKLPEILQNTRNKITPELQKRGYRGAMSNEVFIGKDKKPYWIDTTCRTGYDFSVCYTEVIANYSEVIWNIAEGKDIKLELNAKYFGVIPLTSTYCLDNWLKILMDNKDKPYIKFQYCCKKNDTYYGVKGFNAVIDIIAIGNSLKDVSNKLKERIKLVHAQELNTYGVNSLEEIEKEAEKGKAYGINL